MNNQFNLAPKAKALITSAALTSSYVAGNLLATDTNNVLGLLIKYTKGDETGLKVKVEGTADVSLGLVSDLSSATNWYQRTSESTTGGTTTAALQVYEYTATGSYSTVVYPIKGDGIRVSVVADTLGSSPGTVSVTAITSWV